MEYPVLYEQKSSRQTVEVFGGYNRNLRIAEGEFRDMENLTSDYYPVLSPRSGRAQKDLYEFALVNDKLCGITVNHGLFLSGKEHYYVPELFSQALQYHTGVAPSYAVQHPVNMGSFVVIPSIKKWINLADIAESIPFVGEQGNIDAVFTLAEGKSLTISLCKKDGSGYESISDTEPENLEDGALWLDTSGETYVLKQWNENTGMWTGVATTYLRLQAAGIGKNFQSGDGVRYHLPISPGLEPPNCTLGSDGSAVIQAVKDDFIVVPGLISTLTETQSATIARIMPEMDFVIECNNRLWGCKAGVVKDPLTGENKDFNEIYCSKLGDFKNWDVYQGISTDSYRVSIGADGPFTGAINYLGYPVFFKENFIIRVSGDYPANFRLQTTVCEGVQQGCGRSVCIVNNVIYYWSKRGVCAFDGSLPVFVGNALGSANYTNAVGGSFGGKYYLSVENGNSGTYTLFVYDTAKGLWHKETGMHVQSFTEYDGQLLAMVEEPGQVRKLIVLAGGKSSEKVEWFAETGPIGITTPDMKTVIRLTFRLSLDMGASLRILAKYDFAEDWEQVCTLESSHLRSFSLPIRPKRCDHMQLRLEGTGDCKLYSITKTVTEGSELS